MWICVVLVSRQICMQTRISDSLSYEYNSSLKWYSLNSKINCNSITTRYYVIIWLSIFLIQQSLQTGNQAYKFGILLKPIINKAYFILVQKMLLKYVVIKKLSLAIFYAWMIMLKCLVIKCYLANDASEFIQLSTKSLLLFSAH